MRKGKIINEKKKHKNGKFGIYETKLMIIGFLDYD